ncbi:histidine kinase [Aquimarina sp. D1M17]|uniref:sensor histidine kinase n=1 Tax=Aquimarina acroporae TaxID=2937283 RepID=UPI0020BE86EA|nr:histidine kinase [Aquimarina acroporae]MCK8520761.1 histidine kinase [Aquimarina acroporae]
MREVKIVPNIAVNLSTFITRIKQKIVSISMQQVRSFIVFKIAVLITLLINLPRALSLFHITDKLVDSFSEVSIHDIVIRVIYMFFFSLVALLLNANWKDRYAFLNIYVKTSITVVLNTGLYLGFVYLFINGYTFFIGNAFSDSEVGLQYFVYFVILLICIFVASILRYQIKQQKQLLENERLKQQNLQKELTALKNQINPHFLFNSLNSLNALIRGNKEATKFVNNLSFLYRYILQSGERDLVTVEEELKFLQSYILLIKTRYQDRFNIDINIDEKLSGEEIPPLAMQLLVENAVKHNEISQENPLHVRVYSQDQALYVENIIKPRTSLVQSTGNGLANLDKRYYLLKKEHILIDKRNGVFVVKLPLNRNI